MIRPDVRFSHVDALHFRRWIDLCARARRAEPAVFALVEAGRTLRVWHTGRGLLDPAEIPPEGEARQDAELLGRLGAGRLVRVNREAWEAWREECHDAAQARKVSGVAYQYSRWDLPSFRRAVRIFPEEDPDFFGVPVRRLYRFLCAKVPQDAVVVAGVHEGSEWWTSAVGVFRGGELAAFHTFQVFPPFLCKDAESETARQRLLSAAADTFGIPAFGAFFNRAALEEAAEGGWEGFNTVFREVRPGT